MRTPAGTECRFYYQDFHRERAIQECRLIKNNPQSDPWQPNLCQTCPVPDILRANSCPNMILTANVGRRWLVVRRIKVSAFCTLSEQAVSEPKVGCGRCHEARWQEFEARMNPDNQDQS